MDFPLEPHLLREQDLYDPHELINVLMREATGPGDVLFFNSLYWVRLLPTLQKHFPKTIFIQRSGGNDLVQAPIPDAGATLFERRCYLRDILNRNLDVLIMTSRYSLERVARMGIHKKRMRAIVGGVDIKRFTPATETEKRLLRVALGLPVDMTLILDVSRLVPFKGISHTLAAFDKLQRIENVLKTHLIIVGDGPERHRLERIIRDRSLNNVTLIGQVPPAQIQDYYRAADIFCHTPIRSRYVVAGGSYIHTESMGRCLMEAAASGLPIITTQVGGTHEAVISNGSIMIPPRDDAAIAEALVTLLRNPDIQRKYGHCNRQVAVERFAWEHVFEEYFSLIETI